MKKNLSRIILTLVFIALAGYFLYPTVSDYMIGKDLKNLTGNDSLEYITNNAEKIRNSIDKRIKLGLDLKGGMYVVMDVDVVKLLEDLANPRTKNDEVLLKTLAELYELSQNSDESVLQLFIAKLKAQGKTLLNYYGDSRQDEATVEKDLQDKIDKAIEGAVRTIRNRIDQYGVAEPQIQTVGGKRIIVELPGVSNTEEVRKLLKQTAILQFQLLADPQIGGKVLKDINRVLAAKQGYIDSTGLLDTNKNKISEIKDSTKISSLKTEDKKSAGDKEKTKQSPKKDSTKVKKDTSKSKDTNILKDSLSPEQDTSAEQSYEEFVKKNPFTALFDLGAIQQAGELIATPINKEKIDRLLKTPEVLAVIPDNIQFAWSQEQKAPEGTYFVMYILKKEAELTGKVIEDARADIDPISNRPRVTMGMNSEGANEWSRITGANINKRCAIVLDGVVYSAPVINGKITGGNSEITGMPNIQEAKLMEIVLRAGSLPAPLKVIEERSIGPSLGEDSIKAGINSSIAALILVALFMIIYYRIGGSISVFALMINVFFVFGIMASFKATLTVPGIAGLILSIGMAVDTNVLIYERIREELVSGKPMKTALDIGYKKAFSAIIDSHLTSVITGVILYQFGSGPIQGFALTLIFGLASNLFTAIVITHFLFDIMVEKGMKLNFG